MVLQRRAALQSGYEFFKWLDAHEGLINAEDALQDVLDFKLPEGEPTKETITLKGAAFETLYFRQPRERWGMKSDVFKAWTAKFPNDPFDKIFTQIHSINLIKEGGDVLEDFGKANKMLCALYLHWCTKNRKVIIKSTTISGIVVRHFPPGAPAPACPTQ